ncbi:MAG: sigma-54-dependent Fis family transcriptional regulator [Syntrophomonadaceae bacterium]
MGKAASIDNELYSVWNHFVKSGELTPNILDPFIADSWQRSREAGVNPHHCSNCKSHFEVNTVSNLPPELVSAAYPVVEEVYDSVRGSGFRVCLVDENGYIIQSIPQLDTSVNINWKESSVGTNAIGTAIVTGESLQISGIEHYCYEFHNLTTSAAPIFDRKGNLLTVLALMGPTSEDHSHILTMLVKAAEKMVDRFEILAKNRQLKTYNQRLTNIFNMMSDGVIIFSSDGTIDLINPAVEHILGRPAGEVIGTTLHDLLDAKPGSIEGFMLKGNSFSDVEVFMDGPQGKIHCLASGNFSRNQTGEIDSGMMVLQNMDRINRLVSRFTGARAQYKFNDIIGSSAALMESINIARMAAMNNSNVLLQGESGTGKEVFAQAIHNDSFRRKGPFVAINCGAIPRELVASELFGYVEGAFTGAKRGGSIGKFEMASGGTIFLDEIGDMPFELQVALLRVLQNRRVTRIGDSKEIPVDVRVICATNKDLRSEIEQDNFREDLYYRLNVISVNIPPLRDRVEDIPQLIKHFLGQLATKNENILSILESEIIDKLKRYDWPGNVRELQNVVERLVCTASQSPVSISDLPVEIISSERFYAGGELQATPIKTMYKQKRKQMLAEEESQQIISLLQKHQGNITRVAEETGFTRMTIYRKMNLYDISRDDYL